MKTLLIFLLTLSFVFKSHAQVNPLISAVDSYWQWSQNQNQDAESVDECLEKIYSSQDLQICTQAISDLTQAPLNSHRREVLVSLLQKIPLVQQSKQQDEFFKGLLLTHPDLASDSLPVKRTSPPLVSSVEVKAWLKALAKKTDLKEALISLNGQPLKSVQHLQFPQGVYQWTLIAPHMDPIVIVGNWNDFSTQLGKFKEQTEEKNWLPTAPKMPAEHLGDLPVTPQEKTESTAKTSHTWVWVTLLAVSAGVAAAVALKDKNVSVTMPGFR
jgi:hypothetical protein